MIDTIKVLVKTVSWGIGSSNWSLCDPSPKNVKKIMMSSRNDYWKEDYDFLKGQRRLPQHGSMGCVNRISTIRV
jgi:hypothetical protein